MTVVGSAPRVLVITAGMGAGHTTVARELARRIRAEGGCATVVDLIAATGAAGARLRGTYRCLLKRAPWLYGAAMEFWARWPGPLEALTATQAGPFEQVIAHCASGARPDVVVSTYNLASQCLGRLVARGRVCAPVITFVVDPGAHPYWVSPHVHEHLALTPLTARRLEALGAARVGVVAPVLSPAFDAPPARAAARRALGLPASGTVVVLTAGSWAAGGVRETLGVLRRVPGVLPVVLCGQDEQLLRALQAVPGVQAVPWTDQTDQVASYLAAADLVVDNAGGQTCWEALACGTRVVIYRPLPGHGRRNAATLDAAGLATWVHNPVDLAGELARPPARRPASRPRRSEATEPGDAVAHILAASSGRVR